MCRSGTLLWRPTIASTLTPTLVFNWLFSGSSRKCCTGVCFDGKGFRQGRKWAKNWQLSREHKFRSRTIACVMWWASFSFGCIVYYARLADLLVLHGRLFTIIPFRFPNLCVAVITRDSARQAFRGGITASQIIRYLNMHAHPKVIRQMETSTCRYLFSAIFSWSVCSRKNECYVLNHISIYQSIESGCLENFVLDRFCFRCWRAASPSYLRQVWDFWGLLSMLSLKLLFVHLLGFPV